ncbi:MAG: hypothetical protein JO216_02810 [Hyphomicrobiales bacterium]|nr:hypothetical protein [Hyphomicrobiales bacterium]
MCRVTEFGIIAVFQSRDGRLTVQPRMFFPTEEDALRAAEIFADVLGGAVAFTRVVDRERDTAEDGVIIAKFGVMAEGAREDVTTEREEASRSSSPDNPVPPLRESPGRYIVTFFEAQLRLCALARMARREGSSGFTRMRDEEHEPTFQSAETLEEGNGTGRGSSVPENVELLAAQARRLHELDAASCDSRWFTKMTGAWAFTLAATDAEAAWSGALACATEADEEAFFNRVLAPWIAHRFRQADTNAQRPELADLMAAPPEQRPRLPASASACG